MNSNKLFLIRLFVFFLFTFIITCTYAQVTVTGIVTDGETQEGIPGANVSVKGTLRGTVTNLEGEYTIEVNQGETLVFSFVGYLNEEVTIQDQTQVNVILLPDITSLDEVVVVGYGQMKRSEVTGAISSVDVEAIQKMPVASAAQALQGRAAGVQVVQNSGAPGEGVSVRIRGVGTINNSEPLYVVDGIVVEDINNVNPNDIESTEVLKDAASAAVYGSRAANGVVLITTKQGKSGKLNVDFNTYLATKEYWRTLDVMGPAEYERFQKLGTRSLAIWDLIDENRTDDHPAYENAVGDWVDKISQDNFLSIQKYNLALTGGSETINYYISGNLYDEAGTVLNSDYRRYNLVTNLGFQLTDNINLRTNFFYSSSEKGNVPKQSYKWALLEPPISSLYDEEGYLSNNPFTSVTRVHDDEGSEDFKVNLFFDWDLTEHLTYSSTGSYQRTNGFDNYYREPNDRFNFRYGNYSSNISNKYSYDTKWQFDNILVYDNTFDKHKVGLTGVVSMEGNTNEFFEASNQGTLGIDEDLGYLYSGFSDDDVTGDALSWTLLSFITRANYSFDGRYLVNAVFRADGSSRFAEENRWGYFPSISLGWRITEENFWTPPAWLDLINLRVNYGINGNDQIGHKTRDRKGYYATYPLLYPGANYVYGSEDIFRLQSGWVAQGAANPSIVWENTTSYNTGANINMFSSLFFSFDYFVKQTNDMLLRVPIVPSSGFTTTPFRNAGEVENRGVELSLNYKSKFSNFGYDIGLNFSYIRNEVLSLGQRNDPVWGAYGQSFFRTKTEVGQPIGEFYGWVTDGIFETREEVEQSAQLGEFYGDIATVGDVRFVDLNNDGTINDQDRTFIGSPHPDYLFGANLSFDYKGFDLTAFVQGVIGNDIYNIMDYHLRGFHGSNAFAGLWDQFYMDYMNPDNPNDTRLTNTNTELPRAKVAEGRNQNYRPSDFFIKDGSYIRIKNVQLGYNFSSELAGKLYMDQLRIYVGALNLFTFTDYNGLDPEIGGEENTELGFDDANYPQARSFLLGINVSF